MEITWIVFCAFLTIAGATPKPGDINKGLGWLTRYGYLSPPDPYSAQQQKLESLTEAVRTMQRFAGLEQTGQLDDKTLEMMKKPRCSLPDVMPPRLQRRRRKRYALSGTVWQKKHLTWSVGSFPSTLSQGEIRTLMNSALEVWGRETDISFSETREKADIRVSFAKGTHEDGYPFDGPGGTLGHAFFPGVGEMAGETHMDNDEYWTYNTDQGTDVFAVAVHEFGHALGLYHSSADNSIMKPYYQGTVGDHRTYRLPQDDINGIQALYGRRDNPRRPPPPRPTQHAIPPRGPTYQPRFPYPERCSTHFDAIANIRGEIFFFKNRYFWRLQSTRTLVSLIPAQLHHFWNGLPLDLPRLDAVYERQNDSKIVFIAGNKFWVFKDTMVEPGYPRFLSDFGLKVDRIDGAFVWKHNKKTYFFRGDKFWRYDEKKGKLDDGYPHGINLWEGLSPDIDDVTSWVDGNTYFFKGSQYWQFTGANVEAEPGYPRSIAREWMYCNAEAPTQPPEGRDQKGCHCACSAGNKVAARFVSLGATSVAIMLGLLISGS
ncbi:matrix metalloproteinase-25 [Hyperolius riggenbachi]|uniref:matrix metalloproteinase-25 n=1 Tax=Hyperolius riggenbachi TaxID=752182 RepID=UPI0035A29097